MLCALGNIPLNINFRIFVHAWKRHCFAATFSERVFIYLFMKLWKSAKPKHKQAFRNEKKKFQSFLMPYGSDVVQQQISNWQVNIGYYKRKLYSKHALYRKYIVFTACFPHNFCSIAFQLNSKICRLICV